MNIVHQLLERNQHDPPAGGSALEPKLKTLILACADHRADPHEALGLDPGDAVIIRNAGGRITPGVLTDLAILSTVGRLEGLTAQFELIVMHHTDCGTSRLTDDAHTGLLAAHFGTDPAGVQARAVDDPRASVAFDVELLRANPFIPDSLVISGVVYDIDTGKLELVAPPNE